MDHQYGYGLIRQRSGMWRSLRDGDFEEEDVWDVLRERRDDSGASKPVDSSIPIPKKKPTTSTTSPRMIPTRAYTLSSGNTSDSSQDAKLTQQSAPVNIPNWSKVVRKRTEPRKPSSKKGSINPWLEDDDDHLDYSDGDDENDEEEDVDGEYQYGDYNINYKAPPHEIIAGRLARSHLSSFSVFEGAGRTLKGRDLEKVRNAVLTKTGFLESL